ncbi:hypothetical protein BRC68_13075 [Halobacteriales archaeon QH_6_64_20]|nr:MAG: hypothetical protein BRC68_13075 [Halobacteriales archaeon QH_6_64_20]
MSPPGCGRDCDCGCGYDDESESGGYAGVAVHDATTGSARPTRECAAMNDPHRPATSSATTTATAAASTGSLPHPNLEDQ